MKATPNRLPRVDAPQSRPGPQYCTVGDMLCEVRVWTEARWDATPAGERPVKSARVPGLGWVVAVPAGHLPAPNPSAPR